MKIFFKYVIFLLVLCSAFEAYCIEASNLLTRSYEFSSVHNLHFGFNYEFPVETEVSDDQFSIFLEYKKNQPISEKMYLVWSPLPLGVGMNLETTEESWSSAEWFMNIITNNEGVGFVPTFTGKRVSRLGLRTAYDIDLSYGFTLPAFKQKWAWRGELATGPRFSFSDNFVFAPSATGSISNVLLASLFDDDQVSLSKPIKKIGIDLDLNYRIRSGWIIMLDYGIAYVNPLWSFVQHAQISTRFLF